MSARAIAAAFDAIAMVAAAFVITSGKISDPRADLVIWGSAGAAVIAALVVLTGAPSLVGWVAIGYVIFAGVLAVTRPVPLLLLLAVAFMPLLERPRRSLLLGLATSIAAAVLLAVLVRLL